jgi:hypothetical protein
MALLVGEIKLSDDGEATKLTGIAGELYPLLLEAFDAQAREAAAPFPEAPQGIPAGPDGLSIKKAVAGQASALSQWLYGVLTISAQVRVSTTTAGLQRDPATSDPTLAPATDQFLTII